MSETLSGDDRVTVDPEQTPITYKAVSQVNANNLRIPELGPEGVTQGNISVLLKAMASLELEVQRLNGQPQN